MKKISLLGTIITLCFALLSTTTSYGQIGEKGNGNIVKKQREVENFNAIDVGGAFNIFLTQGDDHSLFIETDENLQERIKTEVKDGELFITSKFIRKASLLNIYVSTPELNSISISGAAEMKNKATLGVDYLSIDQSGASELDIEVNAKEITASTSGASELELKGITEDLLIDASGASSVNAKELATENAIVESSGSSRVKVNVSGSLTKSTSGASSIRNISDATEIEEDDDKIIIHVDEYDDEDVYVKGLGVEVHEDSDSTQIKIGRHRFVVDEWGNVRYKRWRKNRFNGHWAGIDLGVNGYLTPENDMKFEPKNEYLDLVIAKSIKVGINFFEQNLPLSKNQKWGLITGLGWEINNYRFNNDVMITSDSAEIQGFYARNISMRKSKLVVNYLEIPVLFEFQTNRYSNKKSFHFTAGMIFGLRISSHTKRYFEEQNKEYQLVEPENYKTVYDAVSPGNKKVKDWDDFHLNPFKADATVRIGWGWINLFGTYSFTTLFRDGKGLELYPFSAGITLSTW